MTYAALDPYSRRTNRVFTASAEDDLSNKDAPMTTPRATPSRRALAMLALLCIGAVLSAPGCGKGKPTKAQKTAIKDQKDAALVALPYPTPSATLPKSLTQRYDPTSDRTEWTLVLTNLAPSNQISGVGTLTWTLTSSHKGKVRAADNPEGSVDASITARTTSPGTLAYTGSPGVFIVDGAEHAMKDPSGGQAYISTPSQGAQEESLRFRVPTKALIDAVNSKDATARFGRVDIALSGQALADLREFAARLKPGQP